ncbi:MAG: cytochrome c oxidase subunit 3 [Akkermansiaceae bacterium]|nr:cytochrome c oxidase subunit 3 [Akkermansiaceae bacterium]
MEIPYIVTPRKDTGLFNSKIAIWLFLASEVMLFGGFFSAYVFLRLGADYPWPERTLPVLPGLINTFVLIGSSVTVVFAWASLKMRKWRHFQIYMGITITCALLFMVLKAVEYNVKFHHQAVRLTDYTVVEGHLGYEKENGEYVLDHHGRKIEENMIQIEASGLTFSTVRHHKPWVEELITQAEHRKSEIKLAADVKGRTEEGGRDDVVIAKAGEPLSLALLAKIREAHLDARAHNGALRTAGLRSEWKKAKTENPGKRGWELASAVNVDVKALDEAKKLLTEFSTVSFKVDPPARFDFKPRGDRRQTAPQPDGFPLCGCNRLPPPRHEGGGEGPGPDRCGGKLVARSKPRLRPRGMGVEQGAGCQTGGGSSQGLRRRSGDRQAQARTHRQGALPHRLEGLRGQERRRGPRQGCNRRQGGVHGSRLQGPRGQGDVPGTTPAWNTYYAIYFAITGLHGLHVIGGALVLAYYLFFGRKMYDSNPEWLANRVEVGGLFWHFVDLVWIFVFPIFYLM